MGLGILEGGGIASFLDLFNNLLGFDFGFIEFNFRFLFGITGFSTFATQIFQAKINVHRATRTMHSLNF